MGSLSFHRHSQWSAHKQRGTEAPSFKFTFAQSNGSLLLLLWPSIVLAVSLVVVANLVVVAISVVAILLVVGLLFILLYLFLFLSLAGRSTPIRRPQRTTNRSFVAIEAQWPPEEGLGVL